MEIIKPIKNKITIDNRKKVIKNFWVNQEENNLIDSNPFMYHSKLIKTIRVITRKCIYIQTNKELDYEFIEALNSLWSRGINIYLLTNKLYSSYKNTIAGKVLIRYSSDIVGDLILIDSNTNISRGLISDSSDFHDEKKYLSLNSKQIEECFEMFIYKFWKKTDFECINEETFNSPIETQEAPFDIIPKLNTESIISDDYLSENIITKLGQYISNVKKNITLITNNVDITDILFTQIADKNENVRVEIITNIKKGLQEIAPLFYPIEDYDIYGVDDQLYPMIILDNSIAIVFTNEIKDDSLLNSFCIINDERVLLDKIIGYKNGLIFNEKTYRYKDEAILNEINEKSIITDINNINLSTCIISEVDEIKGEPEICDSLIDLYNNESKRKFVCDNKYAKVINYSYYLMPKYRDEKLNRDKLYDNWKMSYLNIKEYSEELLNEVEIIAKENSNLFDNIRLIFSNNKVDSKETIRGLNYIIEETSNNNYSIEELNKFDNILKNAYSDYIKLNANVLEMNDYKEQLEKWENSKKEIQYKIDEVNNKLSSKEKEIREVENSLVNDIIVKLEENIINKNIEIDETMNNIINESDVLKFYFEKNSILESFNETMKKSKLKKKKDIDNIIVKFKEVVNSIFNDSNYFDNNYKAKFTNSQKSAFITMQIKNIISIDLNEFINKNLTETDKIALDILNNLKDELNSLNEQLKEEKKKQDSNGLNKKVLNLNKDVNDLKTEKNKLIIQLEKLGENFEYKTSKKNANVLNVKKFDIKIINEELPKVGVLYSNKNIRQLAIKYWEELELGIEEAERLNAELVCEVE